MKNYPILIGTTQGIVNLVALVSIEPAVPSVLRENKAKFGIYLIFTNDEHGFYLYDDEAENFLGHLLMAFWLPGSMTWLPKGEEGGNND